MTYKQIGNDFLPKCPSCTVPLAEVLVMEKGVLFIKSVLVCPHCHTLLGFAEQNLL